MCDERERLIGYVYDECDAGDRGQIDQHLETCGTCREEIAGLRATRQDLLAWEVPDHGSVWKPFVPVRLTPWYREVPAWAMAAAAGLILFIGGVGGGVTATVLMTRTAPAMTQQAQATAPAPIVVSANQAALESAVAREELTALEARLMAAVRANNAELNRHVSASNSDGVSAVRVANRDSMFTDQVAMSNLMWRRLKELEERNRQLDSRLGILLNNLAVPGR